MNRIRVGHGLSPKSNDFLMRSSSGGVRAGALRMFAMKSSFILLSMTSSLLNRSYNMEAILLKSSSALMTPKPATRVNGGEYGGVVRRMKLLEILEVPHLSLRDLALTRNQNSSPVE